MKTHADTHVLHPFLYHHMYQMWLLTEEKLLLVLRVLWAYNGKVVRTVLCVEKKKHILIVQLLMTNLLKFVF